MTKPKIYLAGPITGLTYKASEDWRTGVIAQWKHIFDIFSPLRACNDIYENTAIMDAVPKEQHPFSLARGILSRDHMDCKNCDLIFVNLLGAKIASLGTVMEIGFAYAYRKPIVLCMEPENLHNHAMINEAADYKVTDLHAGMTLVESILLPYSELNNVSYMKVPKNIKEAQAMILLAERYIEGQVKIMKPIE